MVGERAGTNEATSKRPSMIATAKIATKPTAAEMLKLVLVSSRAHTPPTDRDSTLASTSSASMTEWKASKRRSRSSWSSGQYAPRMFSCRNVAAVTALVCAV